MFSASCAAVLFVYFYYVKENFLFEVVDQLLSFFNFVKIVVAPCTLVSNLIIYIINCVKKKEHIWNMSPWFYTLKLRYIKDYVYFFEFCFSHLHFHYTTQLPGICIRNVVPYAGCHALIWGQNLCLSFPKNCNPSMLIWWHTYLTLRPTNSSWQQLICRPISQSQI